MKQKNLKEYEIMDYIYKRKKAGQMKIIWRDIVSFQSFMNVVQAISAPLPIDRLSPDGFEIPDDFPNGYSFMGIKHYIKLDK